jgi:hypothetical protein
MKRKIERRPAQISWDWFLLRLGIQSCRSQEKDREAVDSPFSREWIQVWQKIAEPYSLKGFNNFLENNGIDPLKRLKEKKANPNFLLCVLVDYMWNEHTPPHDYEAHERQLENLKAVWITRHLIWSLRDDPKRRQMVDDSLVEIQERVKKLLSESDYNVPEPKFLGNVIIAPILETSFKPEKKKRSPDDKVNRVIFIMHEHLKHTTGGPQWSDFLDLLSKTEAISVGSHQSPDRRILPHVLSFEKHHPTETARIKQEIGNCNKILSRLYVQR